MASAGRSETQQTGLGHITGVAAGLVLDTADKVNEDDGEQPSADDLAPRAWRHAAEPRIQHPERPVSGVDEQIAHLPVAHTTLNKKLLRIFLSRFKASLNGDPDPNNPFIRYYSPFCLQDPLVVRIILYTSACFLHETGHVRTTALRTLKGHAIHMLNESLRPHSADRRRHQSSQDITATALATTMTDDSGSGRSEHPSDAAIAGVIQLTVAEWYWGESEDDLRCHLRGLRGMVRLRGGFNELGMNGLLAKNAIMYTATAEEATGAKESRVKHDAVKEERQQHRQRHPIHGALRDTPSSTL
ncbi:hypothetical protein ColLi_08083 [Colletotrichum liriopes]|uniref:Uncharacterized protein n=1 Tax=Colletotrichum liriopes TaxID=708192 RepID=A0AA37GR23_9PEZI|nr:hypothetical protein ColLi_08083 [Colletotrichum liriopes]